MIKKIQFQYDVWPSYSIYIFTIHTHSHTTCIDTIHFSGNSNSNSNSNSKLNSFFQIFAFKKWLTTINNIRRCRSFCVLRFSLFFYSILYSVYFCSSHHYTFAAHFFLSFIFFSRMHSENGRTSYFWFLEYFCSVYYLVYIRATCKIVLFHMLFWWLQVDHRRPRTIAHIER